MFEDLRDVRVDVGEVVLRVRHGGAGTPVLLIHGHPRTGSTWHAVTPRLLEVGHSVVVPDMRGYGQSSKAPIQPDHSQQSKRAVADDLVAVMDHLGHRAFAVVGHDRGALVGFRLAMDCPKRVSRLVVLDAIPIIEHLDRCDEHFARAWYHWFFFAVADKPERAINTDPIAWYAHDPDRMGFENHAEWIDAVTNPDTVRAMLEDYRAGLGVDAAHERADRAAGRVIQCPTLMLWSDRDDLAELHGNPLTIWRSWCTNLAGAAIESGHHMAEDNARALSNALIDFLDEAR